MRDLDQSENITHVANRSSHEVRAQTTLLSEFRNVTKLWVEYTFDGKSIKCRSPNYDTNFRFSVTQNGRPPKIVPQLQLVGVRHWRINSIQLDITCKSLCECDFLHSCVCKAYPNNERTTQTSTHVGIFSFFMKCRFTAPMWQLYACAEW